jgi:spore maturation protein CgeB
MKIVVFGLTVTSAWGNGHATLWRALCRALDGQGHRVTFFERNVPYYASHRDFEAVPWCDVVLYDDWHDARRRGERLLSDADAGIVTSFCPDGPQAAELLLSSAACKVFYDLDSPVTLERLARGERVAYLPDGGLGDFDLVFSYAGGPTLGELATRLGARRVRPLYGSVDPAVHHPVPPSAAALCDLSYLGTYAADRQDALEALFVEPARRRPDLRFVLAGSQYPQDFPWTGNIYYRSHMPPPDHASFFSSSRLTLNITRGPMAAAGYCPSGRLFEAAACGAAMVTDPWPGLEEFFEPEREVLVARGTSDVLDALERSPTELQAIGSAARDRAVACHSADVRAREMVDTLQSLPPAASACGASEPRSRRASANGAGALRTSKNEVVT